MNNEISRRRLLKMTASAATALAGSHWAFRVGADGRIVKAQTADPSAWKPTFFTGAEIQQLAAVCEAIIPRTKTPGARDARVHEYIDVAMTVEAAPLQDRFRTGLAWLEAYCQKQTKKGLANASGEEITRLLATISDTNQKVPDDLKPGASFFTDVKSRTLFGFYTSREGWVEDLGRPEHVGMEKWAGCPHPEGTH
jgi:hypothetical protein